MPLAQLGWLLTLSSNDKQVDPHEAFVEREPVIFVVPSIFLRSASVSRGSNPDSMAISEK